MPEMQKGDRRRKVRGRQVSAQDLHKSEVHSTEKLRQVGHAHSPHRFQSPLEALKLLPAVTSK